MFLLILLYIIPLLQAGGNRHEKGFEPYTDTFDQELTLVAQLAFQKESQITRILNIARNEELQSTEQGGSEHRDARNKLLVTFLSGLSDFEWFESLSKTHPAAGVMFVHKKKETIYVSMATSLSTSFCQDWGQNILAYPEPYMDENEKVFVLREKSASQEQEEDEKLLLPEVNAHFQHIWRSVRKPAHKHLARLRADYPDFQIVMPVNDSHMASRFIIVS
jgi:hypothetical protein